MPMIDDQHLMLKNCTVVYDGMNRPDEPNSDGNVRRKLKVVLPPNSPDEGLLEQLATSELATSEFKGVLPNGGTMPSGRATAAEFNGLFPGQVVVNCSTFRIPPVYGEDGKPLADPMQYLPHVYSGQKVDVLIHCKSFNNVSKGVAARMDGFMILASQNAPRQSFAGSSVNHAAAFGGGGATLAAAPAQQFDPNTGQPVPAATAAPAQQFDPNTGQPVPAATAAPAQQFDPNTGQPVPAATAAPAQQFDPNTGQPVPAATAAPAQQFDPNTGQPVPAATAAPAQQFDPNTGQPVPAATAAPAQQFDPNTGQPVPAATAAPAQQFDPNTGQPVPAGGAAQAHNYLPQ